MPREGPLPHRDSHRRWTLDAAAFEALLSTLDPDRDRAALTYERLRQRIITLLRWWGVTPTEELADRTLDRVARKLADGAVVPAGSLAAYVRGVARMVCHEWRRDPGAPGGGALRDVSAAEPGADEPRVLACLDGCLADLDERDRRLVLAYYADGKAMDVRRRLAETLGVSPTALRIRVHRLRAGLERCVSACADERAVKRLPGSGHPSRGAPP